MRLKDYEKRYYASVSSNDELYSDLDIASSEFLLLRNVGGNAVYSNDVKVEIVIDPTGTPEILLTTHGDTDQSMPTRKIEGPKKIRIRLVNYSSQSETIGGYISGEYYGD